MTISLQSPVCTHNNFASQIDTFYITMKKSYRQMEDVVETLFSIAALKQIPLLFLLIAAVRLLFVVTYPPNIYGDSPNYYYMIREWRSNLVHAGGYACFMNILVWSSIILVLWRTAIFYRKICQSFTKLSYTILTTLSGCGMLAIGVALWFAIPRDERGFYFEIIYQYYLIVLQQLLFVLVMYFAHVTLSNIFGTIVSYLMVVCFAFNPRTLSFVSCVFPEWLQGSLLVTCLCLLYWAMIATDMNKKRLWYVLAATAFAWCILTKPNFVVMGIAIPFVFLMDRSPMKYRVACIAWSVAVGMINYAAFIILFHYPSTGTLAFTHNKAWLLLTKVAMTSPDQHLDPNAGVNTKRLLYLNDVLPRAKVGDDSAISLIYAVENVNVVPLEMRAPYREKYLYVLCADEAILDRLLHEPKPARKFDDFYYPFCPTYTYLGMAEGDDLGTKVFIEHILAHSRMYFSSVAEDMVRLLWDEVEPSYNIQPNHDPAFPLNLNMIPHNSIGLGFVHLKSDSPTQIFQLHRKHYYSREQFIDGLCSYTLPIVWQPGVTFFATWQDLSVYCYHRRLVFVIISCGLLACFLRMIILKRFDTRSSVLFLLSVMLMTFYISSTMVAFVRWKETLPTFLLITVLFVGGLLEIIGLISAAIHWCCASSESNSAEQIPVHQSTSQTEEFIGSGHVT